MVCSPVRPERALARRGFAVTATMSPWSKAGGIDSTDLQEEVVDLTEDVVDLTEELKEQETDLRENGIQVTEANGMDSDAHLVINLQDEEVSTQYAGLGAGEHSPVTSLRGPVPERAPCPCAGAGADKPYACDTCGKRFTKLKYLRNHERIHYKDTCAQPDVGPSESRTTEPCSNKARKKKKAQESNLKENESKSTRALRYPCSLCGVAFALLGTLKAHVRLAHPGQRPLYYCSDCKKPFLRHTSLRRHERTHDSNSYKFSCGVCPRKFAVYQSLQSHILRTHRPPDDGSDGQGTEKQFDRSSVSGDRGAHAEEKPYTCGMCDEGFDRLSPFKEHARVHM